MIYAYTYTGEVYGDSTQLLYLRARYYSSNTGRFISRDTWSGNAEIPMSFNKWNYVGGNPVNLTDPSGNFPPLWCQFMPNRAFYEGCVDLWYGIEPITHLGEYVVGERGCYTGPFEYRAPGHFQGTGLTLALPWIVNWRFEVESVYDFATFEHSYFINGTDQIPVLPGIGASDFVWGGMLDQYAGFVSGFRTDTSIGSDYSGPAITGFFGASAGLAVIDPFGPSVGIGIAGFVSLSDPRVRGAGVYVSIGFGVDAFPFAYDGGFGLLSLTNRPFTVTNYKNDNNSINKARLFYDIISARHDIWVQGFNPQTYAAGFPSRTATAMMALTYARVYEEIMHGIK
jgi:RHS repeat-associated protein